MKGFGIEIKNNLLEPKHVENMGVAVWLYMWLIDKITYVNHEQIGVVLGKKPIKYEEVRKELGISQDTYTRWIEKLAEYPYIEAIRTPHGISFRVFKAKKRFRKSAECKDSEDVRNHLRKSAECNKTVSVDSISKTVASPSELALAEFNLKTEIKKLEDSSRKDLNIVALYLEMKRPRINNKAQFNTVLRRHLKPAGLIAKGEFEDAQIVSAAKKAQEKVPDEWTLETVYKYITK